MKNELNPLSDKQKENIRNYFKNYSYTDFLFAENEKITIELNEKLPLQINETPAVSKEKMMETIVSKYKGKVVVVDFWATWCVPCLEAMEKSKSLKQEMGDKDVIFIYITNPSSPLATWKTRIQTIGGEHYYLTKEEWDFIANSLKMEGIPTYVLYDSNGALKDRITAYPGNEKMRKIIDELLP